MNKNCIWCFESEPTVTFNKKAHSIPKSLGGQNFNKHVCDNCNEYFGATTQTNNYSIEEALKETFCISRQRFLGGGNPKRQVGQFKSKFFDIKERNGKPRLTIKQSFLFKIDFQKELCRNFKRGLLKMWFEEFDRQSKNKIGNDIKYKLLRDFARYNLNDLPVIYFERRIGVFVMTKREAETPILLLNRMKYLYEDEKFTEIEFLGHVFGFPFTDFSSIDFKNYISSSIELKKDYFTKGIILDKLIEIDFTLKVINS